MVNIQQSKKLTTKIGAQCASSFGTLLEDVSSLSQPLNKCGYVCGCGDFIIKNFAVCYKI